MKFHALLFAALVCGACARYLIHTAENPDGGWILYPDETDNEAQCTEDGRICIGTWYAAQNRPHLQKIGVTHIVTAIGEPEERVPLVEYLIVDVADQSSQDMTDALDVSYNFIGEALDADPQNVVLVHCAAGVSRSASIVINYWMRREGMTFDAALARLRAIRPVVNPNPGFVQQLRKREL